jgi:hypothetical protein
MSKQELNLLPEELASRSISPREIVLPLRDALEAIDILEKKGILILGWEGWVKGRDGRVGHVSVPQGTVSLDALSVHEAAEVCRRTMLQDTAMWEAGHKGTTDELLFCITVRA